jgi:hypothetical protein
MTRGEVCRSAAGRGRDVLLERRALTSERVGMTPSRLVSATRQDREDALGATGADIG